MDNPSCQNSQGMAVLETRGPGAAGFMPETSTSLNCGLGPAAR